MSMRKQLGRQESRNEKPGAPTSTDYQQNYQQDQRAATYNAKYRDRWTKRISTWREFGLLDKLLRNQGPCKVLLDLPCGGGRLSPPMARYTDLLIEADVGLGQVRYGRKNALPFRPDTRPFACIRDCSYPRRWR